MGMPRTPSGPVPRRQVRRVPLDLFGGQPLAPQYMSMRRWLPTSMGSMDDKGSRLPGFPSPQQIEDRSCPIRRHGDENERFARHDPGLVAREQVLLHTDIEPASDQPARGDSDCNEQGTADPLGDGTACRRERHQRVGCQKSR